MDDLGDILSRKRFTEPPEIKIIKQFVLEKFDEDVAITVKPKQIIIDAPNAALAGSLRMHLYELQKLCKTDKRLVLRIGN